MKKMILCATLSLLASPVFAAPAGALTGALTGLPVVGSVLGGVSGSLPALPVVGALPVLGALPAEVPPLNAQLGVVLMGRGVIVGVDSSASPPVSLTPVGLPPLPGLPN